MLDAMLPLAYPFRQGLVALVGLALTMVSMVVGALELIEVSPGNFVHFGGFAERSAENLGDNANIGFILGTRCVAVVDSGGSLALGRARQVVKPGWARRRAGTKAG